MNNSNMPDTSLLSVQQSISTSFPVVEISRMDAPWWWDVVKCYKLLNAKKTTQCYYDPICSPLCLKCQNSCGTVNISINIYFFLSWFMCSCLFLFCGFNYIFLCLLKNGITLQLQSQESSKMNHHCQYSQQFLFSVVMLLKSIHKWGCF